MPSDKIPYMTTAEMIDILRGATLDDNPFTGSLDAAETAFEPAMVDFMHALADYLEAAKTTIGTRNAISLVDAHLAVATVAATVDLILVDDNPPIPAD